MFEQFKIDGKLGVKNTTGVVIIKPQFDSINIVNKNNIIMEKKNKTYKFGIDDCGFIKYMIIV